MLFSKQKEESNVALLQTSAAYFVHCYLDTSGYLTDCVWLDNSCSHADNYVIDSQVLGWEGSSFSIYPVEKKSLETEL